MSLSTDLERHLALVPAYQTLSRLHRMVFLSASDLAYSITHHSKSFESLRVRMKSNRVLLGRHDGGGKRSVINENKSVLHGPETCDDQTRLSSKSFSLRLFPASGSQKKLFFQEVSMI
jgi:hypothetical protein